MAELSRGSASIAGLEVESVHVVPEVTATVASQAEQEYKVVKDEINSYDLRVV